ncbi:MAG: transglutaminase family protein [Saprospiraceae bacterium]|nr:transglutaminase family protein [Bacteroidia bacterium]NNE15217.1 transglutaminase family protein [Saprospiraceae bacterium]NNL93242.1 transglutaminase family protein [Saprospiraceae bacterium]
MKEKYLSETYYLDFSHPNIQEIIKSIDHDNENQMSVLTNVFLKVREEWKYNPYHINLNQQSFKASQIAQLDQGHCIDKSTLLIACLRALGIPARIHLAKVKNHIAVEKLVEKFGTNELTPHGYVGVFINEKWMKISPAFNQSLCDKFNVEVLGVNENEDAIFQQYNNDGNQFMEYLEDYGHFDDIPFNFIINNLNQNYPTLTEIVNEHNILKF